MLITGPGTFKNRWVCLFCVPSSTGRKAKRDQPNLKSQDCLSEKFWSPIQDDRITVPFSACTHTHRHRHTHRHTHTHTLSKAGTFSRVPWIKTADVIQIKFFKVEGSLD